MNEQLQEVIVGPHAEGVPVGSNAGVEVAPGSWVPVGLAPGAGVGVVTVGGPVMQQPNSRRETITSGMNAFIIQNHLKGFGWRDL